ncbi:MAG TPA: glycosyltransferase family 39 protein, partial [Candidatus Methylomirabilis sp.]|nr:glycosyltransferase family 39 protein [Candidatus Methylomirabilis sp.]
RLAVRGFRATPKGFALGPGGEGEIEYAVRTDRPLTPWSAITLQWYGGEPGIQSRVDLLGPDGPHRLAENRSLLGTLLFLPESVAGWTEIGLRFRAQNSADREHLILDKLVIQSWEGAPARLPNGLWVGGAFLSISLGLAGFTAHPRRAALVALMLTLALVLRYINLLRIALAPLDPDAQGYRVYAQTLAWIGPHGFYSASFGEREPFFPSIVKLALALFGDSDLSLRLLTLALSTGVVYLTSRLGRDVLGFAGGLGAGLLVALSVPAIIESGRGLRVETEALLLVGSAWLLLGRRDSLTWGRAILGGALAGTLLLTRFPYALALALLLGFAAWWHRAMGRDAWRPILVAAAIAAVLVLPHRVALTLRQGDAAYDAHRTIRWIANQEFQGRPGFPSEEAVVRDPYAGSPLSLGQYYFGLHSPWEVVWRSARGLARAFGNLCPVGYVEEVQSLLGPRLGWVDLLVAALGIIGLLTLMGGWSTGWIPLVLLLGLAHTAFVYDLSLPDYRFRMILQVIPLFGVAVASGGGWIMVQCQRVLKIAWPWASSDASRSSLGSREQDR